MNIGTHILHAWADVLALALALRDHHRRYFFIPKCRTLRFDIAELNQSAVVPAAELGNRISFVEKEI